MTLVICCTAAPIIQSCILTKSFHCCSFLRWYILGFWGDTIYWHMGVALDPNAPCVGVYFEMLMPFASCNALCIVQNLLESAQRSNRCPKHWRLDPKSFNRAQRRFTKSILYSHGRSDHNQTYRRYKREKYTSQGGSRSKKILHGSEDRRRSVDENFLLKN